MARALHLEVGADRLATLTFDLADKKVNLLTREVLAELDQLLVELPQRRDIGVLVLLSAKAGNFIAGADVEAIAGVSDPVEAEAGSRYGQRLFAAWEALPFPTVAAVRGTCLGGGTELALASTYLLVSDHQELRIGLPEIRLGILPGWGGCVRLPRRVGIAAALDLILAGKAIPGRQAWKIGLADAVLPDANFLQLVRDFAERQGSGKRRRGIRTDLKGLLLERNPLGRRIVFDQARKRTLQATKGQYPAPLRALEVIRIGIERGSSAGFDAEARAIGDLATSPVAKNLIHLFCLLEQAKKEGGTSAARPVRRVGIVGAGVMGGGIAQLVADQANCPVRLRDLAAAPLAAATQHAAELFARQVRRQRLRPPEARRKMNLIRPALDLAGFEGSDLVIEAVVEKLEVKQEVFSEIAARVRADGILASNTSSLSVDALGEHVAERERVVGMHFFHPVEKMPLVEVVVGAHTAKKAVDIVAAFARRLGKTPIVVRDGPGFLVNRLLMFYCVESLWLLEEGHPVEEIDAAMTWWGMPLGPLALIDEVGADVAVKVARILAAAYPERLPLPIWVDRLPESGRLGSKVGKGIYRYDGRRRGTVDPQTYALLGLEPRVRESETELLAERMVLPMINEAARCLAEGIVDFPSNLDLALILGTGFPPFRGGLCRWADSVGLTAVIERLERLAERYGERLLPSAALRQAAQAGGFYRR